MAADIDAIYERILSDFPFYASLALKIRTKDGSIRAFELNPAQQYLHDRLEAQLARTGSIRALILKGRQQGCCLDPNTKVLTAGLKWVPIKTVTVGQALVATDENPELGLGKGRGSRKMRTSVVEKIWNTTREAYRVSFDDGRSVVCSAEHRWLSKKSQTQAAWRSLGGSGDFRDGRDCLRVGDFVRSITPDTWGEPELDDAWFGGMIDGEGSFDFVNRTGADLAVTQRVGDVLARMQAHCATRGFTHCSVKDPRKDVYTISISGMPTIFRVLGLSRPTRFTQARWWEGKRLPDNGWRQIVAIESLGKQALVDIQTSTQTYVAEGFVSHNSTYVEGRFYWRTTTSLGKRTFILTHHQEATNNIFEMAKRYHEHNLDELRPATNASNAKELIFGALDSGYRVGTAGSAGVGRSSTIQYLHGCLGPDSLVVLSDGRLSRICDLHVGDVVRTHTGDTAPVTFISTQEKACDRVVLHGLGSLPLTATPEHRFFTPEGWKPLAEIPVGGWIGFPVRGIRDDGPEWAVGGQVSPRPQGGGRQPLPAVTMRTGYNLGRVLGLFLAEGVIVRQSKAPKAPSAVAFAVHEREVGRTVAWLDALNAEARVVTKTTVQYRKPSKTCLVTAYGRGFAEFVEALCGRLDGKHFPATAFSGGAEFARGLAHGYLAGDGNSQKTRDRRIRVTSTRESLVVVLRDLLASLGYGWAGISLKPASVRFGRNEQTAFILSLCGPGVDKLASELGWQCPPRQKTYKKSPVDIQDGYAWVPVVSKQPVGLQRVYDLEVGHEDHSYCVVQGASHNSEVAFWPNATEHFAGLMQAVPNVPGTEVVLESTANGVGGLFHEMWQEAEQGLNGYEAVFIPWYWQPEYRLPVPNGFRLEPEELDYANAYKLDLGQMAWRRQKIKELRDPLLFRQEYPATPAEAFVVTGLDSFISGDAVAAARAMEGLVEGYGPLILGVDPAREGSDRTSLIFRQGRRAFGLEYHSKKDNMEVAGIVAGHLRRLGSALARVFVDVGGGGGIIDRLHELGFKNQVRAVNFGSKAMDAVRYRNKRAEMWGEMKEWLGQEMPVCLPNDNLLHADLVAPSYKWNSSNQLLLESKEEIKKRGLRSPDGADALALTFAEPVVTPEMEAQRHRYRPRQAHRAATSAGY